jgi:hypothetical protein
VDGQITPESNMHVSQEQVNAYFYLAEHQEGIKQSILEGVKKHFPTLLANEYKYFDDEEGSFLPRVSELTPEFDFKDYIGPESISISEDIKDEAAYILWRFRCRWDIEHGLDIITYKERVIEIASEADFSKINKDNGTFEQEEAKYNDNTWQLPKVKKWWRFW